MSFQGRLNDLSSWDQSHVLVRNKGSIQAGLHMEAQARLQFSTGRIEMFGLENFGGNFNVPGLVTIGPNMRVLGVSFILLSMLSEYRSLTCTRN